VAAVEVVDLEGLLLVVDLVDNVGAGFEVVLLHFLVGVVQDHLDEVGHRLAEVRGQVGEYLRVAHQVGDQQLEGVRVLHDGVDEPVVDDH